MKAIKIILFFLIKILIIYAIFLFMTKELNPINWGLGFRVSSGILLALITFHTYNQIVSIYDMFDRLKNLANQNELLKEENRILERKLMLKEKDGKLIVE